MKTVPTLLLVVNRAKWMLMGLVLAVVLLFPHQDATAGLEPVNLRSASSFAVLAGTAITSTSPCTINGDVGVSPGDGWVPGVPAVIVNGTIHLQDSIAAAAQLDLITAFDDAAGRTQYVDAAGLTQYVTVVPIQELGGMVLAPGIYKSASDAFDITLVDLTLNAGGDPNAVWIFQMASALTVEVSRKVILTGGAQARNIFWQVGSSATLKVDSVFKGNILALTDISVQSRARLDGRALARNGAVTLDGNTLVKQPRSSDQPWRILFMD